MLTTVGTLEPAAARRSGIPGAWIRRSVPSVVAVSLLATTVAASSGVPVAVPGVARPTAPRPVGRIESKLARLAASYPTTLIRLGSLDEDGAVRGALVAKELDALSIEGALSAEARPSLEAEWSEALAKRSGLAVPVVRQQPGRERDLRQSLAADVLSGDISPETADALVGILLRMDKLRQGGVTGPKVAPMAALEAELTALIATDVPTNVQPGIGLALRNWLEHADGVRPEVGTEVSGGPKASRR
jgi:hypothetical protein